MAVINTSISIMSLNVYELNNTVKSQRFLDWKKKLNPTVCSLQETYYRLKDINILKVKGWKDNMQTLTTGS